MYLYEVRMVNMEYTIRKTELYDPALHSSEWERAEVGQINIEPWPGCTGFSAPETEFRVLRGRDGFSVRFRTRERELRAEVTVENGAVCQDSCVEFFIRPAGTKGKNYMNFEMNCIGTLLLGQVVILPQNRIKLNYLPPEDVKKVKRYTTLKKLDREIREETVWYAGLEIPWELVTKYTSVTAPSKGSVWSGNVCKCADWGRYPHWLTWKAARTFHYPADFGEFIFE
jgi:hypothetical protein